MDALKRPTVLLRVSQWLFGVVVLGCIKSKCQPIVCVEPKWSDILTTDCTKTQEYCVLNGGGACSFSVSIAVLSFMLTLALILYDYFELELGMQRQLIVQTQLALDALLAFLWFVAWCWLADGWRKEPHDWPVRVVNNAQAAVVFAFFSMFTWAGSAYMTLSQVQGWSGPSISGYTAVGRKPAGNAYTSYQSGDASAGANFASGQSFAPDRYSVAGGAAST